MKQEHNNDRHTLPDTAETLFVSAADTSLTAREQADMWKELKAYAEFHTPASSPVAAVAPARFSLRLFSGAVAVFVLMVGTGFTSSFSLPGDFLYPVKVRVTEPALGLMHVSDIKKLEYQGEIINNRLGELKELSKIKRLSEAELVIIEDEMVERSEDIMELLRDETNLSIEARESVKILSDILADVKTQEYIENVTVGPTRPSRIEAVEDSLSAVYLEEIADFIVESPEEVNSYIDEVLSEINVHVTESEHKEQVDLEVRDYLADVAEALLDNDIEKAVYYVGEAEQVIEFNAEVESLEEVVLEVIEADTEQTTESGI